MASFKALVAASLVPLAFASRNKVDVETEAATQVQSHDSARGSLALESASGYKANKDWCLTEETGIECEEFTVIKVLGAMFHRSSIKGCEPPHEATDPEHKCTHNAKDSIKLICGGQRNCLIKKDVLISACPENPFHGIRVRWECIPDESGSNAAEMQQPADERAALPAATRDEVMSSGPLDEDGRTEQEDTEGFSIDEHGPMPIAEDHFDDRSQPSAKAVQDKQDEAVEPRPVKTIKAKVVKVVKGLQAAKALAEEAVQEPQTTFAFTPCYRMTRMKMVKTMNFSLYQTNCQRGEGCFKVKFAATGEGWSTNDHVYTDPNEPPSALSMCAAELVEGGDSPYVTFFGKGLQRNDFNTWGICLPKGEGVVNSYFMQHELFKQFAKSRFDSQKMLHCDTEDHEDSEED